jgi:sugar/nucleoside kinase (ribokinase family)
MGSPMNRATRVDVLGVGNALVDVLSHEGHDFVERHGLRVGTMSLVDEGRALQLYDAMGPASLVSGGSAANTMVGIASFGGRAGFVGRVGDDELGEVFAHDIRAAGVAFTTPPCTDGTPTGRCLVVVTPDAQRTMGTFLGASAGIGPGEVDAGSVASAGIVYLEGYLWDEPHAKAAMRAAADAAHAHDRQVAFTLSDPFCVDRHRDEFLELVRHDVDVLFANEQEITALYEANDLEAALARARHDCGVAVVTCGPDGALVVSGDEVHAIAAVPVEEVVDTTGAGDLFAAGFLYGISSGQDLPTAGRLGALAAAEVIGHLGARPQVALSDLAATVLAPS